jgi:Xaa-Pro aminopeptidase
MNHGSVPARLARLARLLKEKGLEAVVVFNPAHVTALSGVACDKGCLFVPASARARVRLYTDFRYAPMVRRTAPWLAVGDIRKMSFPSLTRVGLDGRVAAARYLALAARHPKTAFTEISADLLRLRAVKTEGEIAAIREAARLNDAVWAEASASFAPGMTECDMARVIRRLMIEKGDGEAFETIVCIGANAAECHHVPGDTVWNGREPVLVDLGVKYRGFCSDMTRTLVPKRASALYRRVHALVCEANRLAREAVRPGVSGKDLDACARRFLRSRGFGSAFGHSLGHGVGLEIHEAPFLSSRSADVLEPGMCVTIEPGVYLEGNLGVRIEDLVLVTENGCEVLSASPRS